MKGKPIQTKLYDIPYRLRIRLVVSICLAVDCAALASGELVTFRFEAELREPQGTQIPLPLGQQVMGSYTFDLNTPPMLFNANSTAIYDNALGNFGVSLVGFGFATSNTGDISIGNPAPTTGSSNFLSDQYVVYTDITGITLPTAFGDRHLISAQIRLQDLDQLGLSSVDLSRTPPDLTFFLDHSGPNYDSDHANIYLTFDSPFGGVNSIPFQLTLLAAIPEPSTLALAIAALAALPLRRHK